MSDLYPPIEPFDSGFLEVSALHTIYYEQVGNPRGRKAVFLHGGPGGGIDPDYRRYFDPARWHVVLFDQRGCGKSTPHAELRENTTWDLVEDIERLRGKLGIDRWVVFGGSWGSTLALAYAETHPDRCLGLILRGIFLLRRQELLWFYQEGASAIYPEAWDQYLAPIPQVERGDLMGAYYRRLTSPDAAVRRQAARAWSVWEGSTSRLLPDPKLIEQFGGEEFADAFARIECHYFVHGAFLRADTQLLDDVPRIARIPGVIVQGRYDVVCPATSAWALHKGWPGSRLVLVPDAGHSMKEVGILSALVQATDDFAAP
ncbi:MAG TPA: prolyl aminopeptidase [Vicinamibacteria bacterium]|nr:prolyl aminopeptidase [Vicinamibacteria bacterium]